MVPIALSMTLCRFRRNSGVTPGATPDSVVGDCSMVAEVPMIVLDRQRLYGSFRIRCRLGNRFSYRSSR